MWLVLVWTVMLLACKCMSLIVESPLSPQQMLTSTQSSIGESATTVDIAEARSFHKSISLASHLAEDVEMALQTYSSSSDVYSSSWADLFFTASDEAELQVQMVLEDIERIIQKKEEEHRRLFSQEYDELLSSKYATMLMQQRLRRVLEQIQSKMLAVLRLEAKAHVDDTMQLLVRQLLAGVKEGVVTDGKDLRRLLTEARRADLARLRALTRLLHQRTFAIVLPSSGVPRSYVRSIVFVGLQSLLHKSIDPRSGLRTATRSSAQPHGPLALYDGNHDRLEQQLKETENDMLLALQLSGSVNPYLRTWPFPPLHINVNYLVDPRAYALSREFDPLYDEHKEGAFAPGRAEPIVVPGVPATPFDPNERARPVSSTPPVAPWQKFQTAVRDLFNDDEDEDDEESTQTPQRPKEKAEQSRAPRWPLPRLGGGGGERSTSAPASSPRKGSPPEKKAAATSAATAKSVDVPAVQRNAAVAPTVATEASAATSSTASAPKFGRYSERIRQARAAAQQENAATGSKAAPASPRS